MSIDSFTTQIECSNHRTDTIRTYVVIFTLAFAYLLPLAPVGLSLYLYDEGIRVFIAQSILAGDIPYRDFYCPYGPGELYWMAGLFKVFGTQLIVARLGAVFFNAIIATCVFAFSRNAGISKRLCLIAVIAFLLPLHVHGDSETLYHVNPAIAFLLVGGLRLCTDIRCGRNMFLSGLLFGIAAVFRHDFGVYGIVAALVTTLLNREHSANWKQRRQNIVALISGFLLVSGIVYGSFTLIGGEAVFRNLVVYPYIATKFRDLPYSLGTVIGNVWSFSSEAIIARWTVMIVYFSP